MTNLNRIDDSHGMMAVFEMVTAFWFHLQSMMPFSQNPTNLSWQVFGVFPELLHYFSGILLYTVYVTLLSNMCALVLVASLLR